MADCKYPEVTARLVGQNGNAFNLMGIVAKALRKAGHGDEVNTFMKEATSGDYDNLLATCCRWVNVT